MQALARLDEAHGVLERGALQFLLTDPVRCSSFVVRADLSGKISPERIQEALQMVVARHPIVHSRIESRAFGRRVLIPAPPDEMIIPLQVVSPNEITETKELEMERQFEPSGPFVAATFASGPEQSHLLLTFCHALFDGMAGFSVMRDVLDVLSGATPSPPGVRPLPPSLSRVCGKERGAGGWLRGTLSLFRYIGKSLSSSDIPGYRASSRGARTVRIRTVHLPAEEGRALREICRAQKTTVHGALGASWLSAVRPEFEKKRPIPLCIVTPVDMRRKLPHLYSRDAVRMLMGLAAPVVRVAPESKFWDLARELRKTTDELSTGEAGLQLLNSLPPSWTIPPGLLGSRYSVAINDLFMRPTAGVITNVGPIDALRFRGAEHLSFAVMGAARAPCTLSVSSFAGSITVHIAHAPDQWDATVFERMTTRFEQTLKAAAASAE